MTSEEVPQQDYNTSLDVDEFPYAASEFVEFNRRLGEITDRLATVSNALDDLLDLLNMHISLNSAERPHRFHDQYERRCREATEAVQHLEVHLETLTKQQPEFVKLESVEEYEQFSEQANKSVGLLNEYLYSITEMIESDNVSKTELAEFQLLNTELDESTDLFVDSVERLITVTNEKIEHIVEDTRQDTTTFTQNNPYKNCPICGAAEAQMEISTDLELIRCTECRTEFQSNSWLTWKVIHSSEPIENISLTSEMWKEFSLEDSNNAESIDELKKASKKLVKGTKIGIVAGLAIQVLGLILLITTGNYMILGLAVLVSFLVAIVGVKIMVAVVRP